MLINEMRYENDQANVLYFYISKSYKIDLVYTIRFNG